MLVTVFTPTYNRAHLLPRLYDSLVRQTTKDFQWIVIDDGSVDNTKAVVSDFIAKGEIAISYIAKANGGMHTAHNVAFENCQTELVFCLDSDDILTDNSIELIEKRWSEVKHTSCAGIVAYNLNMNGGQHIGGDFPTGLDTVTFYDLYYKYHIGGDKALVYRTELIRQHEYPTFDGEKFVPLDIKFLLIDEPLSILRDPLRVVEYQTTGYSANLSRVYCRNPHGFIYYHLFRMRRVGVIKVKVKSIIHYIGLKLLIGEGDIVFSSHYKFVTLLMMPLGWLRCRMLKRSQSENVVSNEL